MKYLNESHIKEIGINWDNNIFIIEKTIEELKRNNFVQPVKPYLRYSDFRNRIIAMPAYIGGEYGSVGIKWIASFPDNIKRNEKRANSVVVLNNKDTGKPYCFFNSGLISGIRTSSVTGFMLKQYYKNYEDKTKIFDVGIIGFGPIGQLHLQLCLNFMPERIGRVYIYDKKVIQETEIPMAFRDKVVILDNWQTLVDNSDIVITCTVSDKRYIDIPARKDTLHLNISLRDYCPEFIKTVDLIIVDDWEEICRENTDIEVMHLQHNLQKEDVYNIYDSYEQEQLQDLKSKAVMFNPMGMAVFDISISHFYFLQSEEMGIGVYLPE